MDASGSASGNPRPQSMLEEGQAAVGSHLIHRVNVGDLVTRSAERLPGREMICDGDRRWSYRDFDAWTNRVAHGLSALGLQKGDALALMSGNRAEFLAVYFRQCAAWPGLRPHQPALATARTEPRPDGLTRSRCRGRSRPAEAVLHCRRKSGTAARYRRDGLAGVRRYHSRRYRRHATV